jgi:hypothetical protein
MLVQVVMWQSLPDETGRVMTKSHRTRPGRGSLDTLVPLDRHCLI